MKKSKISILLPAYKAENLLTHVFIPSLWNCSVPCEVIVYDNGGNNLDINALDRDFSFLSKNKSTIDWMKIGDGINIGLNAALNACAEVATGKYFYLPHTDMYLMPGWDFTLLDAVKNHPPGTQLLCSRSIEPTKGHTDYHVIKDYGKEWNEFNQEKLLEDFKDYKDSSIVRAARMPFFFHRKLWDSMGGVDPVFFSYCTDDDLVQTAYDKKIRKFHMIYGSLIYHLVGKSNKQQFVDRDSNAPYEYFVKKWKEKGYQDAKHPAYWHPNLMLFGVKVK